MNTYFVSVNYEDRVILDEVSHGRVIQTIQANDYWLARTKVDESGLWHYPGHGWFEK